MIKNHSAALRVICVVLFLLFLFNSAYSAQIGLGYYNGGMSFQVKWNDKIQSGVSLKVTGKYNPNGFIRNSDLYLGFYEFDTVITPFKYSIFENENGRVSVGLAYKNKITYLHQVVVFYNFDDEEYFDCVAEELYSGGHSIQLILPEVELPVFENFVIYLKGGVAFTWAYDSKGKYRSFDIELLAPDLNNVGIIYYF